MQNTTSRQTVSRNFISGDTRLVTLACHHLHLSRPYPSEPRALGKLEYRINLDIILNFHYGNYNIRLYLLMGILKKIILGIILVPVVLFFAGRLAYVHSGPIRHQAFLDKWEERGVTFEMPDYGPVADEDNFLKAPGIVDWAWTGEMRPRALQAMDRFKAAVETEPIFSLNDHRIQHPKLKPGITLEDLWSADEAFMQVVHEAVNRSGTEPHYVINMGELNAFQKYLTYRAYSHIESGDIEVGLRDFSTAIRLPERIGETVPNLVGLLVEIAMLGIATDKLWFSLQSDNWDEESLLKLEEECRRIQITQTMPEWTKTMIAMDDAEMRSGVYENAKNKYQGRRMEKVIQHHLATSHSAFANSILWDQKEDRLATEFTLQIAKQAEEEFSAWKARPTLVLIFFGATIPNMGKIGDRIIEIQQRYEITVIGCQLKRYYLVHGEYPASLSDAGIHDARDRFTEDQQVNYKRHSSDHYSIYAAGAHEWTTRLPEPSEPKKQAPMDPELEMFLSQLVENGGGNIPPEIAAKLVSEYSPDETNSK